MDIGWHRVGLMILCPACGPTARTEQCVLDGTAAPVAPSLSVAFPPPSPESALCHYQLSDIGVVVAALLTAPEYF